jgi:PAS domain S-box-containing protein
MKALLVEDNAADVRLIRELLKEFPSGAFELQHVGRLDLALERLQSEIFDVVLLDLGLPDSWGVETLTITHKIANGLPIVVLTGLDNEQFALEVVRAGAQDYLVKGRFDSQLLARTIRYAVKRKQAEEEVRRLNAELEMRVAERTAQVQAVNDELRREIVERKRAEEESREREQRLRLATDGAQLGIFEWAVPTDTAVWENKRMYEIFGIPETTDAVNRDRFARETVHPEDLPRFTRELEESMRPGALFRGAYRIRRVNDGQWRWIQYFAKFELTDDGKPLRLLGVLEDITARKQAEEALLKSEERFRALVMAGSNVVFSMGPDGREMRNLDGKGLVPDTDTPSDTWIQKYIPADEQPRVWSAVQKALRNKTLFELEHRFLLADGSLGWAVSRAVPLEDAQGNIMEWFGAASDITERKRAENELRQAKLEWERTFNSVPDLIAILDNRHRIVRVNRAMAERLGAKPEDCVGMSCFACVHGASAPIEKCPHTLTLQDRREHVAEVHEKRLGGDFLVSTTPLHDERGEMVGTVHVARDITERKQSEADLKKINRTLEAMKNSNEAILRATDEQPFLQEVCHIITRDCNHAMVWIGIAEKNEGKTVRPVAYSGVDEGYLGTLRVTWDSSAQGCGPTGTAIRTGQPSMCRNMLTDAAFAPWREEAIKRGYASSLVIPLKEREETWGAITIYSREPDAFTQNEADLLMDLARDLEFGIQSLRMRAARARAEEALRESEERLRLFVEYAPAALAMFDKQMRYLRASQRWRADYGLGDRELFGVSHYDIFPEITDEWKETHRRGLAGEVLRHEADRFERADGTVQWIRWEVLPWRNAEGMVGGILIFTEDISEHIQAQEALRRSQKEAFQREQLRALAQQMTQVREEERKRVARDLHDDLGQLLTAITMDLTWTKRHLTEEEGEVRERLARSIEMVGDGVRSVHNICNGLRPGVLDDLGLPAAIEWQASEFASRTGIDCEVILQSSDLHADSGISTTIFRIFQECLTNVMRHAEAKSVRVTLRGEDGNLVLIVKDDGVGFRESSVSDTMRSLGLLGMKERAQAYGGEVTVTSSPGNGTTVTIRVPEEAMAVQRQEK